MFLLSIISTLSFSTVPKLSEACDANFAAKQSMQHGQPMGYTTWISIPEIDKGSLITRIKAVGLGSGFELASESSSGAMGFLVLNSRAVGRAGVSSDVRGDPTGYSLNIEGDEVMQTVSIVVPLRENQKDDRTEYFQNKICGLLTSAMGVRREGGPKKSVSIGSVHLKNPFSKLFNKSDAKNISLKEDLNFGAMDALFQRAIASGRSIVVIPTVNPTVAYSVTREQDVFQSEMTSTTVWHGPGEGPASELRTGWSQEASRVGLHGRLWDYYTDRLIYQVYILEPGTYSISGSSAELMGNEVPKGNSVTPTPKGVGQLNFEGVTFGEIGVGTVHHDPIYASQNVQTCTTVLVGSGQCVGYENQTVQNMVSAGGDLPQSWEKVPGLNVSAKISGKFASFTAPAGQAILVDGFFSGVPNDAFDAGSCRELSDDEYRGDSQGARCEMTKFTLVRVPAIRSELLKKAEFYAEKLPALTRILSTITLQNLDVYAAAGDVVPGRGRQYSLPAR